MLPNFFVVGAQKAGTTSLHKYLYTHPDIYLPAVKETKFFAADDRYAQGLQHYEFTYFSQWKEEKAIGEVDPDYMYFPQSLERMSEILDLANTKFIFVLRNPIDRAFSHYLMTLRRGIEDLSFEEAISLEQIRISKNYLSNMHFSYLSRGYYFQQIKRFLSYTDKSNMLFILSDDLKKSTHNAVRRCHRFLGVREDIDIPDINIQHHITKTPKSRALLKLIIQETFIKKAFRALVPSKKLRVHIKENIININETSNNKPVLSEETRSKLMKLYLDPNQQLAQLIDCKLDHWNKMDTKELAHE